MTTSVIIVICTLLLLSYIFEIGSSKIKIPSVILLLILGWAVKQLSILFGINLPDLQPALPILGTIGLVLIVLDGSLELEITKKKLPIVWKSTVVSVLAIILFCIGLAYTLHTMYDYSLRTVLINVIPLGVISSAIAIPSIHSGSKSNREFVTYESSISDIFGVIFFNFVIAHQYIDGVSIGVFLLGLIAMLIISFIATLTLSYLMSKVNHSVKFAPIIVTVILIYAIAKAYELPSLVFILLFGLFLANIEKLERNKYIQKLKPELLKKDILKFRDLNTEITFLIRSLFFLLFGFLVETDELLNTNTIFWALGISASIYLIRLALLKLFKIPLLPLLFIAPRGLITILLFLSIPIDNQFELINKSLIIQVIIITALIMMIGLMPKQKNKEKEEINRDIISEHDKHLTSMENSEQNGG